MFSDDREDEDEDDGELPLEAGWSFHIVWRELEMLYDRLERREISREELSLQLKNYQWMTSWNVYGLWHFLVMRKMK